MTIALRIFINGEPASISQTAFMNFHGSSIFTTLAMRKGHLLLWPLHWQRLRAHAQFFDYPCPAEHRILDLLQSSRIDDGDKKIRIIVAQHDYAITIEPLEIPASSIYDGVLVHWSDIPIHPLLGRFKTANTLPYFLARQQAMNASAFEAILLDDNGYAVDGSRTSLMHYDGTTLTSLEGGLDGCMRQAALDFARSKNVDVKSARLKPHQLTGEILLANSLLGVVPVHQSNSALVSLLVDEFRMDTNG